MIRTFRLPGPLLFGGSLLFLASLGPAPAWATSITDIVTNNTPLTVYATYDPSITGNANASTIEATINAAIREIESYIYDPMTVYISFDDPTVSGAISIGTNAGENSTDFYVVNYSNYITALTAGAMSANDSTALVKLPSSATVDPVINKTQIALSCANADALGLASTAGCSGSVASPEGTVYLNLPQMDLSRSTQPTSAQYDLETVAMHEIDEVLGLSSSWSQGFAGSYIEPLDLFRYGNKSGNSYPRATSATTTAYFEIAPGTKIMQFNSTAGYDAGDWASVYSALTSTYKYTGGGVFAQDAIGTTGSTAVVNITSSSPELTALDVIGYDLSPEPSTWSLLAAGAVIVFFARWRISRQA